MQNFLCSGQGRTKQITPTPITTTTRNFTTSNPKNFAF
ncbi:hypothetical protein RB653_006339 [Dictyostelium firmibasis]|uniref:Uncharacterized protein n=1 Tax=Dictyostelium firmibasis TaxID=79012 RepID=A0AAN7U8S0_9MYCE